MPTKKLVHNPAIRKLGKLAPKHDARTLHLSDYLTREVIEVAPPKVAYSKGVPLTMLKNDELGDCTIVGALHLVQVLDFYCEPESTFVPTDAMALEGYERICGYRPGHPNTDNGGILLDVLNAWRKNGIGNRKIMAFAKINQRSVADVKVAIHLFGGIYVGAGLPISAQNQKTWTVAKGPNAEMNSWGGHCMNADDYDSKYVTFGTWGARQKASWSWFVHYVDEVYAVVTQEWFDKQGMSPTGLKLEMLLSDAQKIAS
jgi:hypothetical protein